MNKKTSKKSTAKPKAKLLSLDQLRVANLVGALLYLAEAVAIVLLAKAGAGQYNLTVNFLGKDTMASEANDATIYADATHTLFTLNIAYALAAVAVIGAITHILIATRNRKRYEGDLEVGMNRYRWLHYAIGGSLLLASIGVLVGMSALASLLMVMGLVVIAGLVGWRVEAHQSTRLTRVIGIIAITVPVLAVASYVKGAIIYGDGLPMYLYVLLASVLVLIVAMAALLFMSLRRRWIFATYQRTELAFLILAFIATSAVIWQVFFGQLR